MMSNTAYHKHYLRLAKEAEEKAEAQKDRIRAICERDLEMKFKAQPKFWEGRGFLDELDFLTNKAASSDPTWKKYVAMNQWYIQQAVMYGTAANNELLTEIVQLLRTAHG